MSRGWKCPRCYAVNEPSTSRCENCGQGHESPRDNGHQTERMVFCEVDGGLLDHRGFCNKANAYVLSAPCPFVCPLCRHPLTWQGRCLACFGTNTGERDSWTIPGDRYEPRAGHWVLIEHGRGQRVISYEDNAEALKVLTKVLDGELSPADAHGVLEVLLG
jgi:hypothetical protein